MKKEFEHYWMCGKCAEKMGGIFPENHCCTAKVGICQYCKISGMTLIPWVDFNWPKDKESDTKAKLNRD